MTENTLSIYKDFDGLQQAALTLFKSGYFSDAKSGEQAIVKVMAGAELGLPPFAAMTGIHIIKNKPVLGANVIATLVKNDLRYDYRIKQSDDKACVLTWYENGEAVGEAGFTIQEAAAAGLTGKDNWKKYASDMLFARAISRGSRRYAPGIFGGAPVYTPDEMGVDTDEEGFVEVKVVDINDDEQETPNEALPELANPDQWDAPPPPESPAEAAIEPSEREPYSAEEVKINIQKGIEQYDELLEKYPDSYAVQVKLDCQVIASIVNVYVPSGKGSDKFRYAIFEFLLGEGKGSTKTWTAQEVGTIKNLWLKVGTYGDVLGQVEEEELRRVWNHVQLEQGQTELFG